MDPDYDIARLERTLRADRFVALIEAAESGEAFTVSRDGKPVAVVIGMDEYDRLINGARLAGERHAYRSAHEGV